MYDLGTSLVAGDSLQMGAEALGLVVDNKNPELRYRALFNLGLAHLKRGLAAPQGQGGEALDSALAIYKRAILLHPADAFPVALAVVARIGALGLRAVEGTTIAVRRHHAIGLEQQSGVSLMKQINAAERYGSHGIAVIRTFER